MTSEFGWKVENSKRIIEKALRRDCSFAVSFSGGKDSAALLHLVKSVDSSIPVITQTDDADWPEKLPYINRLAEKYGWEVNFAPAPRSVKAALAAIDYGAENVHTVSNKHTKDLFVAPIEETAAKFGINAFFLGLRTDESNARKFNFRKRGSIYMKRNGITIAQPLHAWTACDVFAYLTKHEIEINPCYFKNRFNHPEKIRLSWIVPASEDDLHDLKYYNLEIVDMLTRDRLERMKKNRKCTR